MNFDGSGQSAFLGVSSLLSNMLTEVQSSAGLTEAPVEYTGTKVNTPAMVESNHSSE